MLCMLKKKLNKPTDKNDMHTNDYIYAFFFFFLHWKGKQKYIEKILCKHHWFHQCTHNHKKINKNLEQHSKILKHNK